MLTLDVHVVSAPQTCPVSLNDAVTPPCLATLTSEGQYQKSLEDGPDVSVLSPVRCVSPEFVNAIAMNPGGRPKEVKMCKLYCFLNFTFCSFTYLFCVKCFVLQRHIHSYREAFEEMDGGPVSPTPTVGGEVFPQTPAFPISPQTPYFNLCKFPLWLTEGAVELRPIWQIQYLR